MRYRNAFPKYPRAMHLFLLILFLWKTTEQAYVDERHMEAFLEGSLDEITKGLKGTVNQTIETKLAIVNLTIETKLAIIETNLKEKFTALEEKNRKKITALEKNNTEKITALEAKFTALEKTNREKIAALEQERIKDLAQINKKMELQASCADDSWHFSFSTGSCFKVSTDKKTWTESKTFCENMGSHLVTVDSAEEDNILFQLLKDKGLTNHHVWYGGNDIDNEGTWKWVGSNTVMRYTNWNAGQPNNGGSGENCLGPIPSTWWDRSCTDPNPFICEKDIN